MVRFYAERDSTNRDWPAADDKSHFKGIKPASNALLKESSVRAARRAAMDRYDLIVLGAGLGGFTAANQAAALGARVALIEARKIGGT